jgi:hypothetical protein
MAYKYTLLGFPDAAVSGRCTNKIYSTYPFFDSNNCSNPNLTGEAAVLSNGSGTSATYVCSYSYLCPYSILCEYTSSTTTPSSYKIMTNKGTIKHQIYNLDEMIVSGVDLYLSLYGINFSGQVEFLSDSFNSITSIPANMFSNCTGLTSVRMPYNFNTSYGVTVGNGAFSGCSKLESIYCYNKIKSVGQGAFSGCISLKGNEISCGNYIDFFLSGSTSSNAKTSLIESNLSGLKVCFNCESYSFANCININSLYFYDSGNTMYNSGSRNVENRLMYPTATSNGTSIYSGCTLYEYAFYKCTGLTKINGYTIKVSNNNIQSGTSAHTYSVVEPNKDIVIPKYVNLSSANNCFEDCTGLVGDLYFESPSSNSKIPSSIFKGCTNISDVYVINTTDKLDDIGKIGDSAFAGTSIPEENRLTILKRLVVPGDWESDTDTINRKFT